MPQGVALIVPKRIDLLRVGSNLERWQRYLTYVGPDGLQFTGDRGQYVQIEGLDRYRASAIKDYSSRDETPAAFRDSLRDSRFYSIDFRDFDWAKPIILDLIAVFQKHRIECWMDNDYGVIFNGTEIAERARNDPAWDWRNHRLEE